MPHEEHYRKLERCYLSAPTNRYYRPEIQIQDGRAEIAIAVRPGFLHAAGAVHGSVYFKALDDAAFFAANSVVESEFLLTASFTIYLLRPVLEGRLVARGTLVHQTRRLFVADAALFDSANKQVGRGNGSFVRSGIPLDGRVGYL